MNRRRITLSGYYGFMNAGDEAVLAGIIKGLRQQSIGADLDIDVLSIDPAETKSTHGVDAAHRYRIGPLLKSIARSDLLLSGGGSLLQDVTSAHGIFYYAAVVRLAQMLGKKTMFIAQGVGPLNLPRSRKLVAGIANRLDAITVRDPESKALLEQIGVTKPVEVTADPALLLPEEHSAVANERPHLVVSLRSWHSDVDSLTNRLIDGCVGLKPRPRISVLPMQPAQDSTVMTAFADRWAGSAVCETRTIGADPGNRLPAIIDALSTADLVVAMRLHALILAAGAGVPSMALSYDPKVRSFMAFSGQDDAAVDIDRADELADLLAEIWKSRKARAENLRERLPRMRSAALRNAEVACALLTP